MERITDTILAGISELAGILAPTWAPTLAGFAADGTIVAAYDNVISRSDAAALIPEDVSNTLIGSLMNETVALSEFTRLPVAQTQTRLPILSALPVAYFVNGDTGLKQTTEVNWANKYLNIEEIACIVPIPESVLDDASFDVWGQVRPLIENAVARTFDAAVFFGTNAPGSYPTSVVAAAIAAGNVVSRGANADAAGGIVADYADLFTLVETDGYDVDAVAANRAHKGALRKAKSVSGNNTDEEFRQELKDLIKFPMRGLWPAVAGAGAAQAVALQADQFVAGVRQDITYKILDQAVIQDGTGAIIYNLAQQDMVAMRVVFRAGWQVANVINYDQAVEASRYPAGVLRTAP